MGRKIFVSYKYADNDVYALGNSNNTTVRDYVDRLEINLGKSNIYKGEHDGEDLSHLSESTIKEKLKEKIWDSSVTIVLVSPNMRDLSKPDKEQWIPWEISYSVCLETRNDRMSRRNAVLAVVLPDRIGSYGYYALNMNRVIPKILLSNINIGYIPVVFWNKFQYNRDSWIEKAIQAKELTHDYKICKLV